MNKVLVRCWEVLNYVHDDSPHKLYITYPEDNSGHDLICCMSCGAVYAVTVAKEVYVGPPLPEKVKGLKCVNCRNLLEDNYSFYPETYVINGLRYSFVRALEMPDDNLAITKEFYGIYE